MSRNEEIAFYKRTLIENYDLLFNITGIEMLDENESIAKRIGLLDTILMDEKELLKEKEKQNVEPIPQTANQEVEIKKAYILKYITDNAYNGEGLITLNESEYIILASEETIEYPQGKGGYNKNVYYILYKDGLLYTATTDETTTKFIVESVNLLESSKLSYIFKSLFDKLYEKIKKIKEINGGKKASSAYKLNGEKVSLLINKKKLHRSVYVKGNGNGNGKAKYCKINNEFVLLSKLKNKII